jgi:hypothetical protein
MTEVQRPGVLAGASSIGGENVVEAKSEIVP